MQLLLDGDRPALVTMTTGALGGRIVEFHTTDAETGATRRTMALHLAEDPTPGDLCAIGMAVMAVLS